MGDMSSSMLAPTGTRRVLIASIIVLGILFFGTNIFVTRGTNADLVSFTPDQVKLMTSKMTTQEATIARLATEVDELRALKHDFEALQMNQAKKQPCVQTAAQPVLPLNPPSEDWGPDPFRLEQTSAVPVENATTAQRHKKCQE